MARPVDGRLQGDRRRVSRAAACTNASTLVANESYGCCTTMSRCAISVKRSLVRRRSESSLGVRQPRLVLEVGPVERVELPDVGEVEQPLDRIDVVTVDAETLFEPGEHRPGDRARDLEPDDGAEPAPLQLALDGFEQVVCVVRDLGVAVAREAERCLLDQLHLRETATAGSARSPTRAGCATRARRPRQTAQGPPGP